MKIVDFVGPELIVPQLVAHEKSAVIRELADHLAAHVAGPQKIDREVLAKVLLERERLASTAIGEGVAIPHGKLDAVGKLVAVRGTRARGRGLRLDGRAAHAPVLRAGGAGELDGRAPEGAGAHHAPVQGPEFRTRLMQAKDAGEIFRVIADEDAKY